MLNELKLGAFVKKNGRIALLAGTTGLTGSSCLELLNEDERYALIKCLTRRPIEFGSARIENITCDFSRLNEVEGRLDCDDVYCCLGTTMKKAGGSQEHFEKVDRTYVVNLAKLAKAHGAKNFAIVSTLGANANSTIFYNRVKGLMENDILALGFEKVVIVRPSLLTGERTEDRWGEKMGVVFSRAIAPIFFGPLKKYKPISAFKVAASMIALNFRQDLTKSIYESDELLGIALEVPSRESLKSGLPSRLQ
jgi:uncharacterized protein YbjT (DUF2867 family)